MLTTVAIAGYRSLRDVVVGFGPLTVVTGANGSGKSSLYRALRLLAASADGSVIRALAHEGGLQSALWAGPEFPERARRRGVPTQGTVRMKPISLRLGFAGSARLAGSTGGARLAGSTGGARLAGSTGGARLAGSTGGSGLGYLIDLGIPVPGTTAFGLDPEIKRELVWAGPVARPSAVLVERAGPLVRSRDGRGWSELSRSLPTYSSMLGEFADPNAAPELTALREELRGWRFYDALRTDAEAPARRRQVGTRTPVLAGDGSDLAAALLTIRENGDRDALVRTIADAFHGAEISIRHDAGWFEAGLEQPEMLRRMGAAELSDGTLRYLLLAAALLSARPPSLLVLNEPETSLHPDLLPALGRLITNAARHTQIVVVTHSAPLLAELGVATPPVDEGDPGDREDVTDDPVTAVHLMKSGGETTVHGQTVLSSPSWTWGNR